MSHVRLNVFCGLYSCVKVWNVKDFLSILELMSVGPVTFAPHHESTDGMEVSVSDDHYLYTNDTESDEDSDGYEYMEYIKRNTPRGKKHSRYPGSLTQPLDVPSGPWKYRTDSGVASLGSSPVFPAHAVRKQHSFQSPLSGWHMHGSMEGRRKDSESLWLAQ